LTRPTPGWAALIDPHSSVAMGQLCDLDTRPGDDAATDVQVAKQPNPGAVIAQCKRHRAAADAVWLNPVDRLVLHLDDEGDRGSVGLVDQAWLDTSVCRVQPPGRVRRRGASPDGAARCEVP
jgi:hypothetical protein